MYKLTSKGKSTLDLFERLPIDKRPPTQYAALKAVENENFDSKVFKRKQVDFIRMGLIEEPK